MPGDTFSYNSVMYRTDTLTRTQSDYVERANVLGAKVQYLYKTDPEKRVSFIHGVRNKCRLCDHCTDV